MRHRRPTICVLTSSFPCHPDDQLAAPFLPPFIKALQDHGARTVVYTQDRPAEKKPVVEAPIAWFPWRASDTALSQLKPYLPAHAWRIGHLVWHGRRGIVPWLYEHRVDLCLAAWAVPSGYFAYHAKKRLGVPYCVWTLGSDIYSWAKYPLSRGLIQRVLRHADGVFADGIELSQRVHRLSGRPCGFMPSVRPFPEILSPAPVDIDPSQTNFLFVGRWETVKGIDVLIEAMRLLRTSGLRAHLYVVGKGSLKNFLEHKIRAYNLIESVFLRENIPLSMLQGYLQHCHCLVIPSRSESIPLVFSEGLQTGIPMIVSATGDLATLVQQFHLGSVVSPGDVEQLRHALESFVNGSHKQKDVFPAFDKAKSLFDIQKAAEDFLKMADKILSNSIRKSL